MLTLAAFVGTALPPCRALAEPPHASDATRVAPSGTPPTVDEPNASRSGQIHAPDTLIDGPPAAPSNAPVTGGDKTGVSSQAISVPQGAGKIQGMGESFSMQLSTGAGSFSVPFSLVPARGGAKPSLALAYSSAGGHGLAGVGWDIGVPSISRQTDRGIPKYRDPAVGGPWTPEQDRFVFNGGQELVPICLVAGGSCAGAVAGEVMPPWASGWQYFRPRVEGGYLRIFWSPDHRTWRVQSKSGESMELGAPLDGSGEASALETDPANPNRIFRWNLVRQYDAEGEIGSAQPHPNNIVAYRYAQAGSASYLQDIYDTPPVANPSGAPLGTYAHHTHLTYETRSDVTTSYRRGWAVQQSLRVKRVDVTSKAFTGEAAGPRRLVRRYHLAYEPQWHASLLASVQMEGRCSGSEAQATPEDPSGGSLPELTGCPRLPPMTFGYRHVTPYKLDGTPGAADLPGFEGFDERVRTMANSPPHSVDEELTDLMDINADGLPDVVVTAPALYGGNHGVYFNGAGGNANTFGAAELMGIAGVLGEDTNVLKLSNPNVTVHDVDGDAVVNLLHMPQAKTYSVYAPVRGPTGWTWQGRQVTTASNQSPKIDFTNHGRATRVMDVNGDGLVDVVFSSGTEYQTFFSLGRYPGGDGQYGSAAWSGPESATISNGPVTSCLPWSATPALLSDPDVRIADMNGDGLPDIVRVRAGDIRYWPGRGNGFWGTGNADDCPGGGFGQGRDVAMTTSPQFGVQQGESVLLDDVNGDGLDDLVKVRFDAVDVYLNVDGAGWTDRHVIFNTPPHPASTSRVRLVDFNGSGARDLVWGDGLDYKYIDLLGGERPWVLTHVANGLGKTTDLEYASSTELMLAAEATGQPWQSKAPMPIHVVRSTTERDNLQIVGRPAGAYVTEYTYRDPVYDGQQREFRGFRSTTSRRIGDSNSPTSISESTFLLGECQDEGAPGAPRRVGQGVPVAAPGGACSPSERWRDNRREALKGLPVVTETHDEAGVYLSSSHQTYRLRKLYAGLDGRQVRVAFQSASDNYAYDTAPFTPGASKIALDEVELEAAPGVLATSQGEITLRAGNGRAHTRSAATVDYFGNATDSIAYGCVDGCVEVDERITSHSAPGRPPTDMTGWIWRTVESYIVGSSDPVTMRNHAFVGYDGAGKPLLSAAILAGTLPLDRFHEDGGKAVAPAPPGASADGSVTLGRQQYDAFGNAVSQSAPNQRCRSVVYDTAYAEHAVSETVYAGTATASCGGTALTAGATYDRGLSRVSLVTDLHGEVTSVDYDGFGRLVSLVKPHPQYVGVLSSVPSVKIEYRITTDAVARPYSVMHTQTQDGATPDVPSYRDAWGYVDGLGRAIVTLEQADPSAGDGGQWIAHGLTEYDNKGAARRAYMPWFWSGEPSAFPLGTAPTTAYGRQRYDAFGRQVQSFGLDGSVTLQSAYHAASVDKWDAADLQPGPHQGTYASARSDGHGRAVAITERVHASGQIEARDVRTRYLPTGEPAVISRLRVGAAEAPVVRWIRYDSLGRMVLNVEPSTTKNFSPDPNASAGSMKAWRYAYNDNGDLVGTSDARGCGSNYHYDAGGRILGEDYSPCQKSQQDYSPPDLGPGTGLEVFYRYDAAEPGLGTIDDCAINPSLTMGRVVSVSDRASRTLTSYDGRGRSVCVAKQIAKPGAPDTLLANRYAPRWYTQTMAYDAADRPVLQSTGAKVPQLLGAGGGSFVTTDYTKRGAAKSVGGSYGGLVAGVTRDADGLVRKIVYGDVAATTTENSYDQRRRLATTQTYRGASPLWSASPAAYSPAPNYSGPPSTLQLLLEDADFAYDAVDNPTEIRDWRLASEWPAGAKPVTRKLQYDDLYRLTRIDYQYPSGDDAWVSPFQPENNGAADPRLAKPSPHVQFAKRLLWQAFKYDALGNTVATDDDAKGFYDRSLGDVTNSTYQLRSASNVNGGLTAAYDDAGDLTSLAVRRSGTCLPAAASCSQRFVYEWDELGRLARARRWDLANAGVATEPAPDGAAAAELRYAYDASDDRVLKSAVDAAGSTRHTVYVFDSLELRRAGFVDGDFERTAWTEVVYLHAHGVRLARLHYASSDVPTLSGGNVHVLLELPDHLGSSAIAIDRATSELVERGTYQAYGAAESDYRPERWAGAREDYRFTGKEEDVEVGLQYFGKRYLAPLLGRWVSADPLTVHGLGSDLNAYAYVHGDVLRSTDPTGLDVGDVQVVDGSNGPWAGTITTTMENTASDGLGHIDMTIGAHTEHAAPAPAPSPIGAGECAARSCHFTPDPIQHPGPPPWLGGLLQAVCGIGEACAGAFGIASGNPVSGGVGLVHGSDNFLTGLHSFFTNKPQKTGTAMLGAAVARGVGATPHEAERWGESADSFANLASGLGAMRSAGARFAASAAVDDTTRLMKHLETALAQFEAEGFSLGQTRALARNPALEARFRGDRVDAFFKLLVDKDEALSPTVRTTPRFKFGPDVFDPATGTWWDVTTERQWGPHVKKYSSQFGTGIPLLYK